MLHLLYNNIKILKYQSFKIIISRIGVNSFKSAKYTTLIFVFGLILSPSLFSQGPNLGCPPIENYNISQYGAGYQNWATLKHDNRMFFANYGGLLIYDGVKWSILSTPNNTIIRSLATDGYNKICVGAQGELGCFESNKHGELKYHSILEKIPHLDSDFEDIWQIEFIDDILYAHVKTNEILVYHEDNAQIIRTNTMISDMVKLKNNIYIHVSNEGIHKLVNGIPQLVKGTEILKNYKVVDLLNYDNGILIITAYNGIYFYQNDQVQKWHTNADNFLSNNQARCGLLLENGDLFVGTHLGGIIKIRKDKKADIILDKKHGLQSNTINDMCFASDGSLWVASISGLDKIDLDSSYELFYPDGELEGGVYDIKIWNNRIYFCTSNGVYSIEEKSYYNPFKERDFELLVGSRGQSYNLDLINNELFCGHHKGAYKVLKNNQLEPILEDIGAWKFVSLDQNTIALGTYTGVYILEKTVQNKWVVKNKVNGFEESSRVMMFDKRNHLWISHPYKNVYRIDFNDSYSTSSIKEYDKRNGFQSNNRNYIFPFQDECLLTNNTGIYKYDDQSDSFKIEPRFNKLYPQGIHVRNILENDLETWIISDRGTDRLTSDVINKDSFNISCIIPGQTDEHYIGGFENLYPLDSSTVFICSEKGVKLFEGPKSIRISAPPIITSVSLPDHSDSILYGGFGPYSTIKLDQDIQNINFEFTSPNALNPIQFYRYQLEGLDEDWSDWTTNQSKEYSNLDHGDYTFNVRTVNHDSSESAATRIDFSISTPWYLSSFAYGLYFIALLCIILGLLLIPNQTYKRNTAKLAAEKEKTEADLLRVKEQTERDLEKIRRQKLESEIAFKNKELAMSTMYLLQKNETLDAIRQEVENVEKSIVDSKAKQELRKVANLLKSDIQLENEWENFSINFDQVHFNFLKRLKMRFPKLTPKDQKLCAYLRMNLSTKEIAPILKISVRGVEIARYRLRKKLELSKNVNLIDFMMRF